MNVYLLCLIVVVVYALLVTGLLILFPRTRLTMGHVPPHVVPFERTRYYDCGCRIVGGVGVPGCNECTEPGLRS